MSSNVSGAKTLERELERTRRGYQHLFESVPCYICVLNRDLRILEFNELLLGLLLRWIHLLTESKYEERT